MTITSAQKIAAVMLHGVTPAEISEAARVLNDPKSTTGQKAEAASKLRQWGILHT